jgi:hypothetical protein
MTTAQHTAGPWSLDKDWDPFDNATWAIFDDFGTTIAHVESWDGDEETEKQATANAMLLTAAPTMLSALQAALEAIGDTYDARDSDDDGESIRDIITAAIAKATGEEVQG